MSVKGSSLVVHPPIPQKKLSRYRASKGVYLIRYKGAVIYIGCSRSGLCKSVTRMFQEGRVLSHFDIRRVKIELVLTSLQLNTVKNVLLRHFKPEYNKRFKALGITTEYERRHYRRIKRSYLEQSRFEMFGEHQTDSNHE